MRVWLDAPGAGLPGREGSAQAAGTCITYSYESSCAVLPSVAVTLGSCISILQQEVCSQVRLGPLCHRSRACSTWEQTKLARALTQRAASFQFRILFC